MKNLAVENIDIKDGFWKFYEELDRKSVVWNVYERFKETGRFDALRCAWKEGNENKPHIFWDSDVVKWMEGASYLIAKKPDDKLEAIIDGLTDTIAANQRDDGYFNSYFLTIAPDSIFKNRSDHELYCAGHLIEAAIAYHKATGKDKLLSCALKYTDLIYKVFIKESSAAFVTPGHQEIELALLKLYDYMGNEKHLELAKFFIDQRGNNQKDSENIKQSPVHYKDSYYQSHIPVRSFTEAVGHSVRAGYLYTAMAMLAKITDDNDLLNACHRVFDDIVKHKMSITGSVGAEHKEESFSYKYNLPNRDTYNETCAAISLAMFAGAMQESEVNSRYGDIIERIFYNGFISGVSLDGEKFFYANPLEIDRKKYAHSTHQCNSQRDKMFYCSCCPPNIVRMLSSSARYAYTIDENNVYCNQFINSEARLTVNGKAALLTQTTDYPNDSKIRFDYHGDPITLWIRIPDWCIEYEGEHQNGFAAYQLNDGDSITVELPMKVHFIEANPYVQDNSGRFAVQYGPLVYCMEEIDNGENLRDIELMENKSIRLRMEEGIPAPVIYIDACRRKKSESLYRPKNNEREFFTARLIPYFAFANREDSDMIIWTMVK